MFLHHLLYEKSIEAISKIPIEWEKIKNRGILITGATGMIGTCLVDVFMKRNREFGDQIHIYAVGRSVEQAKKRFQDYWDSEQFEFISCDVNQESATSIKWTIPIDYLFHCASNTHPNAYATEPINTIMTNVIGTRTVLEWARIMSTKRVLFFSTVEIYGENRGDYDRFLEKDCGYLDCNILRAGYPEGKRCGEALCQAYREEYGIDIVIPRICRVFGPTMRSSDSKALAQFIKNAVKGEDIVLKSEGNQFFSYCYTPDVVSALLYLLCYGKDGEAYNIADPNFDIRLKELANLLAYIGGTTVIFQQPEKKEALGYSKATIALLDSEKLKQLGWKPAYTLEEALKETVTILREK